VISSFDVYLSVEQTKTPSDDQEVGEKAAITGAAPATPTVQHTPVEVTGTDGVFDEPTPRSPLCEVAKPSVQPAQLATAASPPAPQSLRVRAYELLCYLLSVY
jgi:hypothetical protein